MIAEAWTLIGGFVLGTVFGAVMITAWGIRECEKCGGELRRTDLFVLKALGWFCRN